MRKLPFIMLILTTGCTASAVIPDAMDAQIDKTVTFAELRQDPDRYRGHVVALGGKVLSVFPGEHESRLEILQLPLDDFHLPRAPLSASEGRFEATEKRFVDPALFPEGTRVTLVGEVVGSREDQIGSVRSIYPVIAIRYVRIWEVVRPYSWPGGRPWSQPWTGSSNFQPRHSGWF